MLGNKINMLAQPLAGSFDLGDGMMKKPVEQGGCDNGITKNFAPFCKAAIGGEDHGTLLVTGIDELEEQIAAAGHDRQIADLVDTSRDARHR
nr:hypothetical protein [Mesorhizobium sp. WSM3868]